MNTRMAAWAVVVAVLTAAVLCPASARSQVSAGEQIASLDMGGTVPFAKITVPQASGVPATFSVANPGFLGGVQYIYQVTPKIGVGAGMYFSKYGNRDEHLPDTGTGPWDINSFSSKITGEVLGRYVFLPESKYYPYFIGGLGFNQVFYKTNLAGWDNWPAPPRTELTAIDSSFTSWAFSAGAGVETQIASSLIAGLEARWRYMGNHSFPTDWTSGRVQDTPYGPASEVTLAIRVGLKFKAGS